ncbi:MAG: hypothetical protein BMS9Abin07_1562 [Acidimicrobiia bacterium]|nr:MAG: hypothetical protein BMS9Abin07_1562 [Acidimicrobiia bacterium]
MDPSFASLWSELEPVADLGVPWYVAGGWAIDLFVGRVTREHKDVDLVISRHHQHTAHQHLGDRDWYMIVPHPDGLTDRGRIEPWDGKRLVPPAHQILADDQDGHRIEFLLSEIDQGLWRSRRTPEVTMPAQQMALSTSDGIRYLTPEIVLLYKAKLMRAWDDADFETALLEMDLAQRHWLFHALEQSHPGHPWTSRLL